MRVIDYYAFCLSPLTSHFSRESIDEALFFLCSLRPFAAIYLRRLGALCVISVRLKPIYVTIGL
jgi:hypothetical protein